MIASLQSLRFFFAIMIFFHHFTVNDASLFDAGGSCGVSFFMILSGFVMSMGYWEKINEPTFRYKVFMTKRFIRLYPLHLLCFFGFVISNIHVLGWKNYAVLLPNLFTIQSWVPIQSVYFSGNALAWCLSDMFFFYAVFPYFALFMQRGTRRQVVGIICCFLLFYTSVLIWLPEELIHAIFYINPFFRLYDFVIGIGLYCVYTNLRDKVMLANFTFKMKSLVEIVSIILLIIVLSCFPMIPERIAYSIYYWIPISLIIIAFSVFNNSGGVVSKVLKKSLLLEMGKVSFSFYMIHLLTFSVLNRCVSILGIEIVWYVKFIFYFLIVSVSSILISKYYETPVSLYLKKKLIKWKKMFTIVQ